MTQTLTVRIPAQLARELKAKAKSAKTTPSAVIRRLAVEYVRSKRQPARNALQDHIVSHAGRWNGFCSGQELLRKTRP
jgi:hypothetical protein